MTLRSLQWSFLRPVQKSLPMRELLRRWVASGLLKKGKSKGALADVLGVHQAQVTRILNGRRLIKAAEIPLIAAYLDEPRPDIDLAFELDERPASRMVPIIGYVGAFSQTHIYAVSAGQLDEIEAPEDATDRTVAVEIKGNSLGELFDRWVVFYDDVRDPVTPDLVGKLCVVGLVDERILIKKLRRAQNGLFDLLSNTEAPIKSVAVKWAARVKNMVPR